MPKANVSQRIHAGAVDDFEDGERRLVDHADRTIGVFRVGEQFRAYANLCLHQGGPVCEGRYFPRLRAIFTDDGRTAGERHDRSEPHLVCPWHGWEYDLRTGEFCGDRRLRLASYPIQIEEGQVYVVVE
ncbi:Rieske (2Fe-2S) protein [Kutzneria sp. NPDC052558]|uniref:Rieske (2Fe-2S) protein n=1 Tax=Kutzneria sp. NPDC052558 TaxID=3364121 RepID=UPI0037CAF4DA